VNKIQEPRKLKIFLRKTNFYVELKPSRLRNANETPTTFSSIFCPHCLFITYEIVSLSESRKQPGSDTIGVSLSRGLEVELVELEAWIY